MAPIERYFAAVERIGGNWARRRVWAAWSCCLLVLLVRALEVPRLPPPEPWIHDEFSYLLAADTFASGRVTNPPHPMWPHLETFHVIQLPTYMSMYFPGQGLVLAAGQVLFGRPWIGVYLCTGLFCWALCWMLQGWLPPGWALLGGLLAAMRIGVFGTWMNTYSGTALAGIGGALVLGAAPRILRRPRVADGILMGLGLAILANTRPFEGLLASIPAAVALAVWAARQLRDRAAGLARIARVALPLALVVLPAAAATGYYYWRVTGSPLRMPYLVNRETYAVAPYFLWQSLRPEPVYRHEVLRKFYTEFELNWQNAAGQSTLEGWLSAAAHKAELIWQFYLGLALSVSLVALPWVVRDRRMRFWILAGLLFAAGLAVSRYVSANYLAPMAGAFYVVVVQAMRHLWQWQRRAGGEGKWLVRAACLVSVGAFVQQVAKPQMPFGYPGDLRRAEILRRLESLPGRQLAIVRYSPEHDVVHEWVYNRADIDDAKVVWAREMGPLENSELLSYFRDRTAWLVEPDQAPAGLSPYGAP